MRDGRAPGHDISADRIGPVAGQFEDAPALGEERVEPLDRAISNQFAAISGTFERQHGVELIAEFDGAFGGDLVGAVGEGRDELQAGRIRREPRRLIRMRVQRLRGD